jgi:DNA-binding transcriptional LysR family regulator
VRRARYGATAGFGMGTNTQKRAVGRRHDHFLSFQSGLEAGFTPDVAYVVRDVTVGRAFVAAGVSVALMPDLAIQEPRPDVVVRPVRGLDLVRSLHATWLRGRRHPAIPNMARALADAATNRLGTHSDRERPNPRPSASPA